MCVEIFGCKDPASRQYAIDLGVALQLTNILRDVPGDLERGRVYIPLEDLVRFGCSDGDLGAEAAHAGHGVQSPAVKTLLAFQAAARPRLLRTRRRRAAALRRAPPRRRRDHGRDLPRHPRPDRGAPTTTCSAASSASRVRAAR